MPIDIEAVELLNILGNANRRRILQLLSFRPFYFNEIAKRLNVGPKAVIDHLNMLEKAGLIECYNDQRRKYFRISNYTVLEVALSPFTYGIRMYDPSDYPLESSKECLDISNLQTELISLEDERERLLGMLTKVRSREIELKKLAYQSILHCSRDENEVEILQALFFGEHDENILADQLEVPLAMVRDVLRKLESRGEVEKGLEGWTLKEKVRND